MTDPRLDRLVPSDWKHAERYPLRLAAAPPPPVLNVERMLDIPRQYGDEYDQGTEGACVGYSQSWMMSILNRQCYDAFRLYAHARRVDEWPGENYSGTSLRAGFDVLRTVGHWRVYGGKTRAPMLVNGISENRWARTADEVRASIAAGVPVNLGINWYRQFSRPLEKTRHGDRPTSSRRDHVIGYGADWGPVDGGHAITVVGCSDFRQSMALCNTWGSDYKFIVWLSYASFERLMAEDGEAGIVTDRTPELRAA